MYILENKPFCKWKARWKNIYNTKYNTILLYLFVFMSYYFLQLFFFRFLITHAVWATAPGCWIQKLPQTLRQHIAILIAVPVYRSHTCQGQPTADFKCTGKDFIIELFYLNPIYLQFHLYKKSSRNMFSNDICILGRSHWKSLYKRFVTCWPNNLVEIIESLLEILFSWVYHFVVFSYRHSVEPSLINFCDVSLLLF